jgi:hypothetical protein
VDVDKLIKETAKCRGRFEGLAPVYKNDGAIDDLLEWTLNFPEIRTTIEKATSASLEATAEAGVDTGPIVSFFLKLKATFKGSARHDEAIRTVAAEDQRLNAIAFGEAVLEGKGLVTTDPSATVKEYFRFRDTLSAFAPGQEDKLMATLGSDMGRTVADRWKTDAAQFRDTPQFVYATATPRPIAAVLILPPNEDKRISGSSNAMYPPYGKRVFFGRFGAEENGVRFVNTMYYVADGEDFP